MRRNNDFISVVLIIFIIIVVGLCLFNITKITQSSIDNMPLYKQLDKTQHDLSLALNKHIEESATLRQQYLDDVITSAEFNKQLKMMNDKWAKDELYYQNKINDIGKEILENAK